MVVARRVEERTIFYLYIIVGFVLLYFGAELLVRGSSALARRFGLSPLVIGLTVVAFGTSAPELVVSVDAVLAGANDVSVGNVVGSNIANIGLVLGITVLVAPMMVHQSCMKKEMPVLLLVTDCGIIVALLHPGWVRTDMGGAGAPLEVGDAVADLAATIDRVGPEQDGTFLDRLGTPLPW